MEPNIEIRRLLDIMPASSRMTVKIISKPEQAKVIDVTFPLPWNSDRPIYINFDLWRRLTKPQRDMLLLRTVSWLTGVKWFKPDIYQGVAVAGLLGGFVELAQRDVVGIIAAVGLSSMAILRIWRQNNDQDSEIGADTAAIKIAQRRDYTETEAAEHLLTAIEIVAKIEGRPGLDFIELIRCQNLRATAGLSPVGVRR
ncbi:hypothetical protein NIES4071_77760 [Calothrix sp. NIES-4071]|nr:hypothetical protein NIES4071_77760 [Calothrix sp. NIES-4071]BAZ62049.1 hypothetical protein NIES4105_77700 [Calothrix sp. NIES-4105]